MADNPFSVQVVNPLQALLIGQQAYTTGQENNKKQAMEAARAEAGQLYARGDVKGALSRLLTGGDLQGAGTYSGLDQQQYQRGRDTTQDARLATNDAFNQNMQRENLKISQANLANNSEGPEETASQRAAAARTHGINPGSPEFKAYVLTGALPEGNTTVAAQTDQRKQAALSLGMTPEHPAYQGFILTGKMPREDAQPLTATDKKAILEADEGVLSANTAIDALKKAKELSPKAMGFRGASTIASVGSVLGNQTSQNTVDLDNTVTSNALSQLKAIFGGAPTEGERKILLDIQGSSNMPDAVRQRIYDRAIGMAQARLKFNEQRASEMRGGQFYKPQGSMTRAPVKQTQGITQQQYEALPSGSPFTDPEGNQRIKP